MKSPLPVSKLPGAVRFMSICFGVAVVACTGAGSRPARAPRARAADTAVTSTPLAAAPARTDSAGIPIVPILSRYEVLTTCTILPAHGERADYSGVTVRSEDSSGVELWLVDDKADRVEDAIYGLRLPLPAAPASAGAPPAELTPARVPVANHAGIPTGADIEDLGWLAPRDSLPGLLAVAGEVGAHDAPVSWFYLLQPEGDSLRLVRAGIGSPPGESVGNNGFEGIAVRRAEDGLVEVYLFKERPAPVYARLYYLRLQAGDYATTPANPDTIFPMPYFSTQSGAAFRPGGKSVFVIDRARRLLGEMDVRPAGHGLDPRPRRWLDYTAIDALLEAHDAEAPPSFFGVVEGITEDSAGRLYLVSDNNDAGHSKLVVLAPRPTAPAR